jgi:hypothetical protein
LVDFCKFELNLNLLFNTLGVEILCRILIVLLEFVKEKPNTAYLLVQFCDRAGNLSPAATNIGGSIGKLTIILYPRLKFIAKT